MRIWTLAAATFVAMSGSVTARDLTLPGSGLTPGLARSGLSLTTICNTKWGRDARHVTSAMKQQVFQSYGLSGNDDPACVPDSHGRHCEIDHLISRELGGADDVKNLWPQPYGTTPWNAALKDRVENRLHKEVCTKHITLVCAQTTIVTDWRKAYNFYFGELGSSAKSQGSSGNLCVNDN